MKAVRGIRWTVPLLALLATAGTASAQTRMAIVLGPAINELSGSGVEGDTDLGGRTGLHVGVSAVVPLLGQWLTVAPGALYINKGHTYAAGTAKVKLSYLELAPMVRLAVPLGSVLRVVAFGGPGIGMSFGCVLSVEEPDDVENGVVERTFECTNEDLGFKGSDFTALVGAGLSITLNPRVTLLLQGALDHSLRSIDSSPLNVDLRNHSWLIEAGVLFPLARR
jgi:hypothetical protein